MRTLCHVSGGCKMVQLQWKTVWSFLKKLKVELPYDPQIALLDVHPSELKSGAGTDVCASIFIGALFTIAKRWKQPMCPLIDEWVNTMWSIPAMEYQPASKGKKILIHATTWMNLEDVMLYE